MHQSKDRLNQSPSLKTRPVTLTLVLGGVLMLGGCASHNTAIQPVHVWGEAFSTPSIQEAGHSAVVVYRKNDLNVNNAVAVFVDGRYQASLMPNGYTSFDLCAGEHSLALAGDATLRSAPTSVLSIKTNANKVKYYELVDGATNNPQLVERTQIEDAAQLREQQQTITRLPATQCTAPAAQQYTEKTFASLVLFDLNSKDMSATDCTIVNKMAADIKNTFSNIVKIDIFGYTDPTGSDGYNMGLSTARAQRVSQLLLPQIPTTMNVQAIGKGEQELIVKTCAALPKAAQRKCNAPNRRVEVRVTGVAR